MQQREFPTVGEGSKERGGRGWCRRWQLGTAVLGMMVMAWGGEFPDLTLKLADGMMGGARAAVDVPMSAGACLKGALSFDIQVSDPEAISNYSCYFRSGKGWYSTQFEPTKDEVRSNQTYHVSLTTANFLKVEGTPAGLHQADVLRFAVYRLSSKPFVVKISNLAFENVAKGVVFIRNGLQSDSDSQYLANMRDAFSALGIPTVAMEQSDVVSTGLNGVKLVVIPYAPMLSNACQDALEAYVTKGGKIFAAYLLPERICRLVGVQHLGLVRPAPRRMPPLAGFAKGPDPLAGQPDFAPQASWLCARTRLLAGAKVAAWWRTRDGKTTDIPGLVVSPNGLYLSHVWLGKSEGGALDLFAAAVQTVLPGVSDHLANVQAAAVARAAEAQARLAAMPGKTGERRFIWCHSAWGLGGDHDWNSTCRFAKENGFTDLIVNLAWGGCAFYPSKVLPYYQEGTRGDALADCLSACRRQGLKLHVWKVCWNQGRWSSPEFSAMMAKAGRTSVNRSGGTLKTWNCPSHPENQRLEIDAMVELALEKGVDGIHFDYIRYNNDNVCFCNGCRRRFEQRIGRKVAKWPADAANGGKLHDGWVRFRCDNITTVVKTVAERVKKVRPETEISAAVFRNQNVTHITVGQDWLSWCRAGWLDFVCPMDYIDNPVRFANCIRGQREALKDTKTRFYPGMAFECSHYGRIDAMITAQEIEAVRKLGLDGFAVFHLGAYAESVLPMLRKGPLKEVK